MEVDGASGAARRRRERRLRAWLRHERQSVAAALAEAHHHSAGPRGESGGAAREARGGRGARDVQRFTEPDDTSSGDAGLCPTGPRAAVGRGSHGRVRDCQGAPPGCAIVGRLLGRGH